jgi:hypothetical protein
MPSSLLVDEHEKNSTSTGRKGNRSRNKERKIVSLKPIHPAVKKGSATLQYLRFSRLVGRVQSHDDIVSNPAVCENPDIDPLENDLNRPIRTSQESMTPPLESRKYFTVAIHHRIQTDGTGILQNEGTAIEFRSSMSLKV